jgi:hypothetical protein
MAKIIYQKPYVYLAKTASNYHVSIAMQIGDNETLTGTRSGKVITLSITVDPNTPKRGNALARWSDTFAIPSPDYLDTDTLEVNVSGVTTDYSYLTFGSADGQTTVPASTDALPHVLSPKSSTGSFTPRGLIFPFDNFENLTENVTRAKSGSLAVSVEIQNTTGESIDNEALIINDLDEVKDPNPKDDTTFELKDGNKKRKAKVSNQS